MRSERLVSVIALGEPSIDSSQQSQSSHSSAPEAPGPCCSLSFGQPSALLLGLGLFAVVAWIAFLLYTTLKTANPVIVSRPQVLASPIVLEGQWESGEGLLVDRVWRGEASLIGQRLAVEDFELAQGAGVPNRYIVPLEPSGNDRYRVVPTRRLQKTSTNATATRPSEEQVSVVDVEQVYPATAPVIRQFEELFGQPIETAEKK